MGEYLKVFEDVTSATSTEEAPWYAVPGESKWYRSLIVAERVVIIERHEAQGASGAGGCGFYRTQNCGTGVKAVKIDRHCSVYVVMARGLVGIGYASRIVFRRYTCPP